MLTVLPDPVLLHWIHVARAVPLDQHEHFTAMTGFPYDIDGVAVGNFMVQGPKWAILAEDGLALAVGGFAPQRPGVFRDFFLSTPEAFSKANYRGVTRICRRLMDDLLAAGAHRIECVVPASRVRKMPELDRWYTILGYHKEATHYGYCANGDDAFCYSRVKH
jgi:hypothetical protein